MEPFLVAMPYVAALFGAVAAVFLAVVLRQQAKLVERLLGTVERLALPAKADGGFREPPRAGGTVILPSPPTQKSWPTTPPRSAPPPPYTVPLDERRPEQPAAAPTIRPSTGAAKPYSSDSATQIGSPVPHTEVPEAPQAPANAPPVSIQFGNGSGGHSDVRVFFGTDRRYAIDDDGGINFTSDRGSAITFGITEVTIPASHRRGCLERPSLLRLEFSEDAKKHIVVQRVVPTAERVFWSLLRDEVSARSLKSAFLFVHGFNVSFLEACRRTAQIGYDLQSLIPILFSWPSRGTVADYVADSTAVVRCRPFLSEFVRGILAETDITTLHIITHSMGAQVLEGLVADIVGRERIKELVLAAADIDTDVFTNQIAPALASRSPRVTVYASAVDQALHASKALNRGYPRLGDCEDGVCVVPGAETIDVSGVARSLLNHSTVFDVRTMIEDLHRLLDNGVPAERRGLHPKQTKSGDRYWAVAQG